MTRPAPAKFKDAFTRLCSCVTIWLALLTVATTSSASEPVSLFDGKSLDGWDFTKGVWRVEDGAITAGSPDKKFPRNEFISTKKSYSNFELKLKIRCSGDPATGMINSGIQIRSARLPKGRLAGYQVDCGDAWFGKIYDEHRRGLIYPEPIEEPALLKAIDTFGWNDYRILAEGPRVQVWINGVKASDYTETNPNIPLDGVIAPQIHSGGHVVVEFKDITIRELPPTSDAPTWKSLGGAQAALAKVKKPRPARGNAKAKGAPAKPKKPAAKPKRPKKKTQSSRTEANSAADQLAGFTVPEGFVIELVASEEHGVVNPIDLTFDDAGRLWTQTAEMYPLDPISGIKWNDLLQLMKDEEKQETYPEFKRIRDLYQLKARGKDKILILDDPTKPATEPLHVWADGLSIPQSILPYKDGAYVCHGSELFFLKDSNGDGKSDKMEPVLTGFGFTDTHTMSHLLVRGPGRYVHFSQGALNQGMVTAVKSGNQHRVDAACQVRFDLDGNDFEVLSAGPSNMWGLQLRANGQWYGTEANDRAYCVIPWEHGTAVTGAAFRPMRAYQPLLPELYKFRVGGTGISGLEFSEDTAGSFPFDEWKDVALLANPITSTINAVRVHRNPDGTVEAEHLPDFLSSKDDWFRPVNLEFGPDGCLYVADFYNKIVSHNEVSTGHPDRDKAHGRIWRIRHESQQPRQIPDVTKATPEELLIHLQSPTLWEKRAAWQQIADREVVELIPDLIKLAANPKLDTTTRIHALWSLEELRHFDAMLLQTLLAEEDHDLRREAVRSLSSFDIKPSEAATALTPFIDDEHCMVRSQAIRTLGDLRSPDPAVFAALIAASKPSLGKSVLGGAYERNFERFLARMALERFPSELKAYLDATAEDHPVENLLWAIQALDENAKQEAFLGIWRQVSEQALDSETFIAIAGMLDNPNVFNAVKPMFQDPAKAENLVRHALENQSRVQSPKLTKMLTPLVEQLLSKQESISLALQAVERFQMATLGSKVAAIPLPATDLDLMRQLLAAQSINPELNSAKFIKLIKDQSLPFGLRAEAARALIEVDQKTATELTKTLLTSGDATQQSELTSLFSQSKAGGLIACAMVEREVISADVFDLSSAERLIQAHPANKNAKVILAAARKRVAEQRKEAQKRIHQLTSYIAQNPGDPEKGKLTFTSCLTCHMVGSEGQDIAPPLDGSGHRDVEHLLTAIVDPDAAVEGGYGLYRITKTDGSAIEGYLDKKETLGTTLGVMGGARIFVPQSEIKKEGFVGGRSFMPSAFGQLPEDTLADLVAYISTLKEAAPEKESDVRTDKPSGKEEAAVTPDSGKKPNFIVILTDDQGYGDLGCFGGKHVSTPRIDQMAQEGAKLTGFYVAAPVCTPSRAGLMTGCYPKRIDMATGSNFGVLLAGDRKGMNPDEITIAEVLKSAGYKTGMFGKWHLGDQPEFMPTRQGFDEFFGIPYSHDIHPFHPRQSRFKFPPLPLLDGEEVVEMDPDADFLTKRFTERAVKFIETHKDEPFFLYLPHPIPHMPLHVAPPFMKGVSSEVVAKLKEEDGNINYPVREKLFRQSIAEIDWSVGQILDTLKSNGLDENTLILFTSDNGPGGTPVRSAGPLRGRKGSTFEGGMREPTVARWTGKIAAGTSNDELMTAMDLLPTFAKLAGAKIPSDRVIDGKDIGATLMEGAQTPHETFFYHGGNKLQAVRSGKWKLHWNKGKATQLYNLETDIAEKKNLIKFEPQIASRLTGYLTAFEKELSQNIRPAAYVENPVPLSISTKTQ